MKTFTTKCSILALLLLLLLSQSAFAQTKEGNNWYFGYSGALTWNQTQIITNGGKTLTGLPTPLAGGSAMTNQNEGVFNMSDAAGNLLFYSDGMTIWNRNHQVMQNGSGLFGHASSAQSGIVVPYPGQAGKYIAFSVSMAVNSGEHIGNRIAYSVVDMSLDGGLGGVVAGQKNILLTGHNGVLGESASAVRHSNGVDFWFVAVGKGSGANSALNVWRVTTGGVNTVCVGSYQLMANSNPGPLANGYLRFSVDGKYFAWSEHDDISRMLHFGEFNPSTGTFPTIKYMDFGARSYGVEFSPSTELLYVARFTSDGAAVIYKFAELLAAANPSTDVTPRVMLTGLPSATRLSAMQLGPDGRIYGVIDQSSNMIVIDNPDSFNNATMHHLSGLMAGSGRSGLPNFLPHIFNPTPIGGVIGSNQTVCAAGVPALLTSISDASCDGEAITYLWQQSTDSATWGNATGVNNLSTYQPPALSTTTYFRRIATSATCGFMLANVVKITVSAALYGGVIGTTTYISYGATPPTLTTVTPASGSVGAITYRWQYSTDNTATWIDIAGAAGAGETYSPGATTTITYFRRNATATDCSGSTNTVRSNDIVIIVTATTSMITAPGTTICSGDPVTLTASQAPSYSIPGPEFRWYSASSGGTLLHTGTSFTPSPSPTVTTTYYVTLSGTNIRESPRRAVTVTVTPVALPGMIKVTK